MPRYIDADKLLARYKERCAGCKETKNYCEHCCDLADVIDDIEDAPTADVVERKKGKWMAQKGGGYRCSECKHYALDERDGNLVHVSAKTKFCPYCGADMREEKTDE